jgi:hypothetical protein
VGGCSRVPHPADQAVNIAKHEQVAHLGNALFEIVVLPMDRCSIIVRHRSS